jgi:hypothetical protein
MYRDFSWFSWLNTAQLDEPIKNLKNQQLINNPSIEDLKKMWGKEWN